MDGEKLKSYVKQKGLKISDIAAMLNVSRQTMSTWLKGNLNEIQRTEIIKILKLPKDFFSGSLTRDLKDDYLSGPNSINETSIENIKLLEMLQQQMAALAECKKEKEELLREIIKMKDEHEKEKRNVKIKH